MLRTPPAPFSPGLAPPPSPSPPQTREENANQPTNKRGGGWEVIIYVIKQGKNTITEIMLYAKPSLSHQLNGLIEIEANRNCCLEYKS